MKIESLFRAPLFPLFILSPTALSDALTSTLVMKEIVMSLCGGRYQMGDGWG